MYALKPMDNHKSFYGKAKVSVSADGTKTLYSYGTPVCKITSKGEVKRLWEGYSQTTMRHVNSFLADEGIRGCKGKAYWDSLKIG